MGVVIKPARPDTPEAIALIMELEAELEPLYPKTSRHGLSVEQLIANAVAFFLIQSDDLTAGCGGIQLFGDEFGELKRMYVRPPFRGLGLGKLMIHHLEAYARERGIALLRLETGIYQRDAIGLYGRMGFRRIPPFGSYKPDPLSLFYEKPLVGG